MSIVTTIKKFANIVDVSAHCDIPCGIYDPITAKIEPRLFSRWQ